MNSLPAFDLTGATPPVTGGGSGIGLAMAECFAAAGDKVVLVGRRADVLKEAAHGPIRFLPTTPAST